MSYIQEWIKEHYPDFFKKHKTFFKMISIASISIAITSYFFINFVISPLKDKNTSLQQELLPFKTAAIIKFPSSSQEEALISLATRIGQLELNVISIFDYKEVSSWGFDGSYVQHLGASFSISGQSPVLGWSKNYVNFDNDGVLKSIVCNDKSIAQYLDTIQRFELYPFPYYLLATCQQRNNQLEWQVNMAKAYKIVSITTTIPDHHPHHDVLLRLIVGRRK